MRFKSYGLRVLSWTFIAWLSLAAYNSELVSQQPQAQSGQPLYPVNAKYVNGIAPGYWPTKGSGLTLNISAGTSACGSPLALATYAGGTLTMTDNATNYVFLAAATNCAPTSNTVGFLGPLPIATVVTSGGAITAVTDVRSLFADSPVAARADWFAGADWCAKVAAADAALGGDSGEIVLTKAAGTSACANPPTLSAHHALRVSGGIFALGTNTFQPANLSTITCSGKWISGFSYSGTSDALLWQDKAAWSMRGCTIDLGPSSSSTAVAAHLKSTTSQSVSFASMSDILLQNSSATVSGQKGLYLEDTGSGEIVFGNFSDFAIHSIDSPLIDQANEGNRFINFEVYGFGKSGTNAYGVDSVGSSEQYLAFRFNGTTGATNHYGFYFHGSAGANTASGTGDLGVGSLFLDQSTGGYNVESGTAIGSTTYGTTIAKSPTAGTLFTNAGLTGADGPRTILSSALGGNYRVCYNARTTTSGTGTTGTVSISWSDEGGAKTFTSSTWALNAVDVTGQVNGCQDIYVLNGTNVRASTAGTFGTSVYAWQATAELLQ